MHKTGGAQAVDILVPVAADASTHGATVTRLWSDTVCGKSQKRAHPRWVEEKQTFAHHGICSSWKGVSERTVEDITGPLTGSILRGSKKAGPQNGRN